jgi:hypothetical protein
MNQTYSVFLIASRMLPSLVEKGSSLKVSVHKVIPTAHISIALPENP